MRGLGLIIYGVEGIGKTSFCLQFPKPLRCISVRESGFENLQDIGEVPEGCSNDYAENWGDLINQIREAPKREDRTVVVDSLSGTGQYMKDDILEEQYGYKPDRPVTLTTALKEFNAFSNGWRLDGPVWAEKLEDAGTLLRSKGINIIYIGHTKIKTSKVAVADDYKAARS